MPTDPAVTVPALLTAAGLAPPEDEVAALVAAYPQLQQDLDALYAVDGVRYEEPGVVFHARFPA